MNPTSFRDQSGMQTASIVLKYNLEMILYIARYYCQTSFGSRGILNPCLLFKKSLKTQVFKTSTDLGFPPGRCPKHHSIVIFCPRLEAGGINL